jgi:benzoyl-CoA reductase/2-hydroxyglutaryl-CoA dehydratase subunit BcrC/BadD/HgdB
MLGKLARMLERAEEGPIEFDSRFSRKRVQKKSDLHAEWQKENKDAIAKIHDLGPELDYYSRVFTTDMRLKELQKAKKAGKKIIGIFCTQVPEELIYASGSIPIRLCAGSFASQKLGEELFPRDSCPLLKSSLGFAAADEPYISLCDAIVIPATCDGKKKLAEALDEYRPVWALSVPHCKDRPQDKRQFLSEVRLLKGRLEKLTKKRITDKALYAAISLLNDRTDAMRAFRAQREREPSVISGCASQLVAQSVFFDDIKRWTAETQTLCNRLAKKEGKPCRARILLTGSPTIIPNLKVPLIVEDLGSTVVIEQSCGTEHSSDPVIDEDREPLSAIAERYLMPSYCPCFVKGEDRIDRLLDLIGRYKVDGVINHTLRLCLPFDVESIKLRDVLSQKRIPFLSINTDYSKEDIGQLKTRIEAFFEMIEAKR